MVSVQKTGMKCYIRTYGRTHSQVYTKGIAFAAHFPPSWGIKTTTLITLMKLARKMGCEFKMLKTTTVFSKIILSHAVYSVLEQALFNISCQLKFGMIIHIS